MSDMVAYLHAAQRAGRLLKVLPISTFLFLLGMGEFNFPVLLLPTQVSPKAFTSYTQGCHSPLNDFYHPGLSHAPAGAAPPIPPPDGVWCGAAKAAAIPLYFRAWDRQDHALVDTKTCFSANGHSVSLNILW